MDTHGNVLWKRDIQLPEYVLSPTDNDPLINPTSMTSEVGLEHPRPYQLLRHIVNSRPLPKHGV